MANAMGTIMTSEELAAAKNTYREQIKFGNSPKLALGLATIYYLQDNRSEPVSAARTRIADALGVDQNQIDNVTERDW